MTIVMAFPVESSTEKVVDGAHPVDRNRTFIEGGFETSFFGGILGEEDKIIDINADVDGFASGR